MPNILSLKTFAEKIIIDAGKILLDYKNKFKIIKHKKEFLDIATDADYAAEKYIVGELNKKFPGHNIFSEEKGTEFKKSDYTWVIDPLDGTRQFARGLTFFNVSIALEYKDEIVIGVVYVPSTNELFSSLKGNGVTLNGKRIYVSQQKEIKNSLLWIRPPNYNNSRSEFDLNISLFAKLAKLINRFQPFTEDVKSLAGVAQGGIEAFIVGLKGPNWWDVAPGILMVKEAGGKVTDFKGNPIKNRDLTKGLIASNGRIHNQLLNIVKNHYK